MPNVDILLREDYQKKDGRFPVYLRVFISKSEGYVRENLNIYVKRDCFNKKTEQIVRDAKAKEYNLLINEYKGRASDIILRHTVNKQLLTKQNFLKEFYNNTIKSGDFVQFSLDEIEERFKRGDLKATTKRSQKCHIEKLKEFRNPLAFSELTGDLFNAFKKFMIKRKNKDVTQNAAFKTIRIYVRIALSKNYIVKNPFKDGFTMPRFKEYPKFLDTDNLKSLNDLYDAKTLKSNYQRVLRYFLFACNTGLHIKEFCSLEMEMIITVEKIKYIDVRRRKTDSQGLIPLNSRALQLIADEEEIRVKNKMFKYYSSVKMNEYLKIIAKECLPKDKHLLSFKWARHTFASVLISKGVDIVTVSKLLLHSKPDITLKYYAHLLPGQKERAVNLL